MSPPSSPGGALRVLGIDPGTRVAGWGIVERNGHDLVLVECGVIRASAEEPIASRLRVVFEGARAVLSSHRVDLVAVEEAFFGKNVRSAIRLGEGRAVAILAAALEGVEVAEVAAAAVKKAVVGHGGATKDQVKSAVLATLGKGSREKTSGLPFDVTDALAVAIAAHARSLSAISPQPKRRTGSRWTQDDLDRLMKARTEDTNG